MDVIPALTKRGHWDRSDGNRQHHHRRLHRSRTKPLGKLLRPFQLRRGYLRVVHRLLELSDLPLRTDRILLSCSVQVGQCHEMRIGLADELRSIDRLVAKLTSSERTSNASLISLNFFSATVVLSLFLSGCHFRA
jgi:hypothetical protein